MGNVCRRQHDQQFGVVPVSHLPQNLQSPRVMQCVNTKSALNPFEPVGKEIKTTRWSYVGPGRGSYEPAWLATTLYPGGDRSAENGIGSVDLRPRGWALFVGIIGFLALASWVSSRGNGPRQKVHSFDCHGVSQEHWTKANTVWCCQHAGLGCGQDVAPPFSVAEITSLQPGPAVESDGGSTTSSLRHTSVAGASTSAVDAVAVRRTVSSAEAISRVPDVRYDCAHINWKHGWSAAAEWCCQREHQGCPNYITAMIPPNQYQYVFVGFGDASQARTACSDRKHSRVAMPKTAAQHDTMLTAITSLSKARILTRAWPNNTVWLGAHWEHQWAWDDGSLVGLHAFAKEKLDQISSSSAGRQSAEPYLCLTMDGRWNDSGPQHHFGIVCEERTPTSTNTLLTTAAPRPLLSSPA